MIIEKGIPIPTGHAFSQVAKWKDAADIMRGYEQDDIPNIM